MPVKPGSWCPKCRVSHAGSCPERKAWITKQPKRAGRGGRPWRRKRKAIFERDHYLCQHHLLKNEYVAVDLHGSNAGVCDHIMPLFEGGTDDDDNLQTLCKACSDIKTTAESVRGRGV